MEKEIIINNKDKDELKEFQEKAYSTIVSECPTHAPIGRVGLLTAFTV